MSDETYKHYAVAYTLMAMPNCREKHWFHRRTIHRGLRIAKSVEAVEQKIIASNPGRRILVRYIEEAKTPADILKPRPASYDVNSHLWWEIGCEGECGVCAGAKPPVNRIPEGFLDAVYGGRA